VDYSLDYASNSADTFGSFFIFLYCVVGIVALVVIAVYAYRYYKKLQYEKGKIARSLNMVLYKIMVPKSDVSKNESGGSAEAAKKGVKEFAARASQMFSSLYSIRDNKIDVFNYEKGAYISFEIVSHAEKIAFYIAAPRQISTLIEKQVFSFYPDAVIEETERYNIFHEGAEQVATELILSEPSIVPIRVYKEFEEDTLNIVTTALSKLGSDEGAAVQYIIRPTKTKWQKNADFYVKSLQEGKPLTFNPFSLQNILKGTGKVFGDIAKASQAPDANKDKPKTATPIGEQQIKLIGEKIAQVGFETVIRIVVNSPTKANAKMQMANITSSFSVFNHAVGNKFVSDKKRSERDIIEDFIFRFFPYYNKNILNSDELASIFHFPNKHVETPNISWLVSKRAPAPPEVPKEGLFLGYNIFRSVKTPIYIKPKDRVRHFYILGQTGTGKSTLIKEMIIQDIKNGEGCCYIDPHGTDADDILTRIPKERAGDVIIFSPADFERPLGLNLMEFNRPEEKTLVVGELLNVFDKLYDLKATGGPMFEQYFRNAALLVMEHVESGSTLLEIPKVLADEDFRAFKLSKCQNPIIKNYWLKEAEKAGGDAALANIVPYISSKLTQFLANDIMRPIIAQQKSAFNLREVMDNQKILILRLAKGEIGELNAYLLGLIMVSKIYLAAMSRSDMPEKDRKPFYLYIDEFQNFTTDSVLGILSEARKYQLALTIAHQYIGQLVVKGDAKIRDAVFGNVGTICTYRVGVEDAEFLQKKFEPVFNAYDISNIESGNAYISLLADNSSLRPFSLNTYLDFTKIQRSQEIGNAIKELSRLKYGRDREIVEEEIRERA